MSKIRSIVMDVVKNSTLVDPREIAAEVLRRIPPEDIHDALMDTMNTYCRQILTETRHRSNTPSRVSSHKTGAIRDHWQRALKDRIHVGNQVWKMLGDCDREDLIRAGDHRRKLADEIAAKARSFDALARLLAEHDVQRVKDLPPTAMGDALGAVAA